MKPKLSKMTLAQLETLKPVYLGPCDTFSIPVCAGRQEITVIEATPAGQPVMAIRRGRNSYARHASGSAPACRRLYKRHCRVWVN